MHIFQSPLGFGWARGRRVMHLFLLLAVAEMCAALPFDNVVPSIAHLDAELLNELVRSGSVSRTVRSADELGAAPDLPGVAGAVETLRSFRPNILTERLVLVEAIPGEDVLLRLFNGIASVQNLAYLEYYNPVREKWNEIFYDSVRVAGPADLSVIDDRAYTAIPDDLHFYVLQGLPPFGDVLQGYRYAYRNGADADILSFSSTNEWPIKYRGVRVVATGAMQTHAFVVRTDEYLLMYGVGAARVFTGFGMLADRIENSFTARTTGLFDWLSSTYLE